MRFYINRAPVGGPWGGGNHFIVGMHNRLPALGHEILGAHVIDRAPDVSIIAGLDADNAFVSAEQTIYAKSFAEASGHNMKIVLRVNENDARKGTRNVDKRIMAVAKHCDGVVFVSEWLREYYDDLGFEHPNATVIVNGVDKNLFKPVPKLNNGKTNIVMAHWSDNPMKGLDFAVHIDEFVGKHPDEYTFTFIGRLRVGLKNSIRVPPLPAATLGAELAKYDVCINASRFDPGPNSVIEPIACGLPTYVHEEGGGGVEFAGKDHVFSTTGDVDRILLSKDFKTNSRAFSDWDTVIDEYVKFIDSI